MDSTSDLPPPTEPAAHVARAANPTPSHGPNHNHPPYAEMITAAVMALKEKNGSSRQAIAKYIEQQYSNLPPTHLALLTHHLKRLKNNGQLEMVKNSYQLPRSVPLPPDTDYHTTVSSNASPKRGPGRPPKPRPDVQPQPNLVDGLEFQPTSVFGQEIQPTSVFGEEIQPTSVFGEEIQPNTLVGPESMFVSIGLADGPPTTVAKKGRGRPRKVINGSVAANSSGPTRPGKRGRGRPSKPKLLSDLMGNGGSKKGPGQQQRTGHVSVPLSGGVSRPRGLRKKAASSRLKPTGRPRGRPAKNVAVNGLKVPIDGVRVAKKNAAVQALLVTDPQQLVAYQDLKIKLEHFQSRIKQAVNVLKPCLNNEGTISALGAIQELEELATMDVSTPFNVQGQQPPQPPPQNQEQLF